MNGNLKIKLYSFALICSLISFAPCKAYGELDPRLKALGTMALYGTVGGVLLGTASLAFGTSGRSVAKGASLGLYAGLVFGSYVVITHAMKKRGQGQAPVPDQDYYPNSGGPYENDGAGGAAGGGVFGKRFESVLESELKDPVRRGHFKRPSLSEGPEIYMDVFHYQF